MTRAIQGAKTEVFAEKTQNLATSQKAHKGSSPKDLRASGSRRAQKFAGSPIDTLGLCGKTILVRHDQSPSTHAADAPTRRGTSCLTAFEPRTTDVAAGVERFS